MDLLGDLKGRFRGYESERRGKVEEVGCLMPVGLGFWMRVNGMLVPGGFWQLLWRARV